MQFEIDIDTTVNGAPVRRRVKARQHLADFLREELQFTGTHLGCEHGVCGACSVLVNGKVVRGCLMLAVQADGKRIDTIEGLSDSGAIADLQTAFAERNAAQCGFCTPGMLLTAHEMLAYPLPFPPPQAGEGREGARSRQDMRQHIREFISGNFCRCTGYEPIVDAIELVLRRRPKR